MIVIGIVRVDDGVRIIWYVDPTTLTDAQMQVAYEALKKYMLH